MAASAEEALGITEYLTRGPSITGLLKQRFRDFVVNEIDGEGRVERLTVPAISFYNPNERKSGGTFVLGDEVRDKVQEALGAEGLQSLEDLENAITEGNSAKIVEIICEDDKAKRTLVHKFIKEQFPALTSSTKSGSCIQVFLKDGINSRTKRRKLGLDNRDIDKDKPKFVHFTMWKRNLETMGAIKQIAKAIGTKEKFFGVAGNKDKRGVTTQRVSTFSNNSNVLSKVNLGDSLKIGNFEFKDTEVKMGSHSGNQFIITLRGIPSSVSEATIATRLDDLRADGFVNYFGLQRFGSAGACGTHRIGYYMLKQDYETAVKLMLGPRDTRGTAEAEARERFAATGNVEQALRDFRGHYVEMQVLEGMDRAGGDNAYLNGIMNLPRNSRMIYLHAYQSYVWNKVASARVQLGRNPMAGDLVLVGEEPEIVSAGSEGQYSFDQVVLPLPGSKVFYPSNASLRVMESVLAEDNLTFSDFENSGLKALQLTGSYRKVVVRPTGLSSRIVYFAGMDEDEELPTGPVRSLEVTFNLPSSAYATVLLRELTQESQAQEAHIEMAKEMREELDTELVEGD